jgi:hypothetical protein
MPARLTQAAVALLVMPAYVLVEHALRALRGHPSEPLIMVALVYGLIAALLAVGVLKRNRVAWVGAILLSVVTTVAALYLGWHFGRILITGAARVGSGLIELSLFHVVFLVTSAASLTLLMSGRARRELRGS